MLQDNELVLRNVRESDAQRMAEVANNKKIWENLTDDFPHPYKLENATSFIKSKTKDPYELAITIDDLFIGMVGMQRDEKQKNSTTKTFGYWIGEPHWGKGYATKVVKLFTNYVFETVPELHRLEAFVYEHNPASGRVLEKAGFTKECTRKEAVYKAGKIISEDVYVIFRSEVKK
jgi:[ribosomal protein S5]-alanine N-acetyltransferase